MELCPQRYFLNRMLLLKNLCSKLQHHLTPIELLEGKSCLASVKKLITATLTSTVHALYPGICFIRPATAESAAAAATIEGLVYRDWTLSQARTAAVCTVPDSAAAAAAIEGLAYMDWTLRRSLIAICGSSLEQPALCTVSAELEYIDQTEEEEDDYT
ncbi:hypothetical protein AAC387_Pa04g1604 [Persea americana]